MPWFARRNVALLRGICAVHIHMCIEKPPKYAVASIIGFIRKSEIAIAREFSVKDQRVLAVSILRIGVMRSRPYGLDKMISANVFRTKIHRVAMKVLFEHTFLIELRVLCAFDCP